MHRICTQDFHSLRLDFTKSFQLRIPSILIDWFSRSCFILLLNFTYSFFMLHLMFDKVFLRHCTWFIFYLLFFINFIVFSRPSVSLFSSDTKTFHQTTANYWNHRLMHFLGHYKQFYHSSVDSIFLISTLWYQ